MHAYRLMKRLVASLVVVSLAAACSTADSTTESGGPQSRGPTPSPSPIALTGYPTDFPTSYVDEAAPEAPGLSQVPGGLQHEYTGTLRADDGTTGTYTATYVENRIAAASVTCGGLIYGDVFTLDDPGITFDVDFPDWGSAVLVTSDRIVVYRSSRNGSSPPVCDEPTGGTYEFEFTGGPILQQMTGTWGWDAERRLVFNAPVPIPSPSGSPSEAPA